ncbi:MAG: hypothetical protein JXA22_02215 [Candidatus Thermoplasmatota archaeon]|nr:hypothetical protein [Candidatus Thermoplasmatota archaeon]
MRGSIREMLIFIYGYFDNRVPEKVMICRCLGIDQKTFEKRIGQLMREGLFTGKKHSEQEYGLTGSGMSEYERIREYMAEMEISPELHGVGRIYKLDPILPFIKDPEVLIFLVRTVARKEKKNLPVLLSGRMNSASSSRYRELVEEFNREDVKISRSLDISIRDLTFIGSDPAELVRSSSPTSANEAILEAELLRRCGNAQGSMDLFRHVLSTDIMDPGCWICGIVGIIQCTKTIDGPENALTLCDRILAETVLDPSHRSFLIKTRADLLSDLKRYRDADEAYNTALGIARSKKQVCLPGMIMNNSGVNLFRAGELSKAEKVWYSARKYCRSNGLHWTRVISEINLADIEGKKGNFRKAGNLLRSAHDFMEKVGDLEGLSGVHFNMALLRIEEGKPERAIYYYKRSEEFPLVYENKREERRDVMRERFKEKGWIWENPVSL